MISTFRSTLVMRDENAVSKHGFRFVLTESLVYFSGYLAQTITVPAGFVTDLASIPRALYIALPPIGAYDEAAVVHDYLYQHPNIRPGRGGGPIDRGDADTVLREAMEVLQVNRFKRWLIYRGVRIGGWVPWGQYRKAERPKIGPLAAAALLLALWTAPAAAQAPRRPDATLTPGATRAVTLQALCTPGSASKARAVTSATKRQVFARYHVTPTPGAYEVDHLISLELGGSNDIANLWPQSYTGPLNAHDKDALENQLHALVCKGTVPLAEAQHAIATDWVKALQTYGGKAGPR